MVIQRHQLLEMIHARKQPEVYLETGVQHGWSITLAHGARVAIGIDPIPLIEQSGNMELFRVASDAFFRDQPEDTTIYGKIDMAFIDGMHLAEFALRDFINVEKRAAPGTVVVFDDVLPRNETEADRVQCPGDWTGDVWKVWEILSVRRPDLGLHLCNTEPTGTLIVTGLDPDNHWLEEEYHSFIGDWARPMAVPARTIARVEAVQPDFIEELLGEIIP